MDVGNRYCSKNLNFSVTISTYISSALHENTLPYSCATCYHLEEEVLVVCQQLHLHFYAGPRFIFFHKKITHPLISKIIRHNDKTLTLIFKVLKVQKLMIYLVVILKERKRRQLMLML